MADYDIPPELLDYVLAAPAARPRRDSNQPPTAGANVWLFQANPTIYDIDQALSESDEMSWVVRQHANASRKGDRVYVWRSGSDAGVVATATVITRSRDPPGEADDPFVLKPEALSKARERGCRCGSTRFCPR